MPVHILIADDEEDLVFLIRRKFKERVGTGEWIFHQAKDGIEATAILEANPQIGLVLTDLNMPRMGGLDLLKQLQQFERPIQAVVVSAYGDMENIRAAMNLGAFDFIVKPINMTDLEATVLKTLDHIQVLENAQRAELELSQTRDELRLAEEMARLKSEFFANVSHEFRTPLTLILGPLEDLLREEAGNLPAGVQKNLSVMHRHAGRLRQLIDQLLDVARLEAGKLQLNLKRNDLVTFVRQQAQMTAPAIEQAGIDFHFHSTADAIDAVFDPDQIEKVVANLLSNAFKWTPVGGKIRVAVGLDGGMAFVQVRDNGKGIEPEAIPHIFDRFYQAGDVSDQKGGTGIGLALVKELVSLHGGRISVESEPGFGAQFTVYLPLVDGIEVPEASIENTSHAHLSGYIGASAHDLVEDFEVEEANRTTVMVVEDQPDVRAYIKDRLAASYRVVTAENGREALVSMEAEMPALIISDVMMPEMDGFAFCKAVKQDHRFKHIPVILLTARVEDEDRLEGLSLGADDYIVKPFNAHELLVRAENLIAIRKMLRAHSGAGIRMQVSDIDVPSSDEAFLSAVQAQIEANMGSPDFDVAQLADAIALSPRQLRRRIRALTGLSSSGLLRSLRLQRAAQLLEQRAGTVSEIAYQVGFHHVKYFSRLFKQVYGVRPSEYEGL